MIRRKNMQLMLYNFVVQILPHTLDRYRLRGIVSGLLANILAGVYRFHEMFFRTVAQNT